MKLGVVVIGRNEGERLQRCLKALEGNTDRLVYVDSGSIDGSPELALGFGADVVWLDMSTPFSAARARNSGYRRLLEIVPDLDFIQFVDGDCELRADWLSVAIDALTARPDTAIVAGRLQERFHQASIYNRLGELEWNMFGCGYVEEVGGIFMVRRTSFDSVGGFDSSVPAGEEPELCQRLRNQGWRIYRMDCAMAWHDLAMTRFGQWWKRQVRTGYSSMDVAERFGLPGYRRITLRPRIWAVWAAVTVSLGATAAMTGNLLLGAASLVVLGLWPMQLGRIALKTRRLGQPLAVAAAHAWYLMIAHLPQMLGQIRYFRDRKASRPFRLIEYKANETVGITSQGRSR